MSRQIMEWRCLSCNEINVSDSSERHNLNMCKCGESGVDLEEHYSRFIGDIEVISMKEVDDDYGREE